MTSTLATLCGVAGSLAVLLAGLLAALAVTRRKTYRALEQLRLTEQRFGRRANRELIKQEERRSRRGSRRRSSAADSAVAAPDSAAADDSAISTPTKTLSTTGGLRLAGGLRLRGDLPRTADVKDADRAGMRYEFVNGSERGAVSPFETREQRRQRRRERRRSRLAGTSSVGSQRSANAGQSQRSANAGHSQRSARAAASSSNVLPIPGNSDSVDAALRAEAEFDASDLGEAEGAAALMKVTSGTVFFSNDDSNLTSPQPTTAGGSATTRPRLPPLAVDVPVRIVQGDTASK